MLLLLPPGSVLAAWNSGRQNTYRNNMASESMSIVNSSSSSNRGDGNGGTSASAENMESGETADEADKSHSTSPERFADHIFDRYSRVYPEVDGQQRILKRADFVELLSSDELKQNDLIYLSQIASYIPFDIFNLLYIVSDAGNKGYVGREEFRKFSQQLLLPHRSDSPQNTDLDGDINKLLFFVCQLYENSQRTGSQLAGSRGTYSLNSPISEYAFLSLVKNYNHTDLPYLTSLLHSMDSKHSSDAKLNFCQFSQLMDELPKVKMAQAFGNMKNSEGKISPFQLKTIAQEIFYNKLSPLVADHLEIFAANKFGYDICYDDAFRLVKMIRDLPRLNYLTFEKISNDQPNNPMFYLTSKSLYSYINDVPALSNLIDGEYSDADNNYANHAKGITKDEILLYFNWNRYTYEHLKNHPSVDPSELLAILTDDMVVPNEVNQSYTENSSSNFLHVFSSLHSFVLGSFAGMIGASIVYPIDIIKTRMQNQKGNSMYSSYLDCFKKLVRNEGILGLYSGLLPQIVGVAPEKAIKLTLNDLIRGFGKKNSLNGDITLPWEVLAGSTAGLCQVIVTNPLEVSKIRLQTQGELIRQSREQGKIVSPKSAIDVVRELGLRGLYRGAGACLLRDIPFSSIYFPTYANIKKRLFGLDPGKPGKRSSLEAWELLTSGALAGMPAALLTTPCDVIKTRIQTKPKPGSRPYTGIGSTFKRILVEEGPRAFFKGGIARICRSSPQFGFTLAAYELFQKTIPLSLFYDTEAAGMQNVLSSPTSSSSLPAPMSLSENSKRFKLSSSASSADLNPTLLALTNYYKFIETEKRKGSK